MCVCTRVFTKWYREAFAFTGGADYQDHETIFHALDQTHKKYPDMVLIHGGSPKGAELIAAKWAELRKVAQVVCKPDWTAHRNKSAPFKRNDKIVEVMPKGMIVTPGNGINQNLADKARRYRKSPIGRALGA